jgi:hypothetical protein
LSVIWSFILAKVRQYRMIDAEKFDDITRSAEFLTACRTFPFARSALNAPASPRIFDLSTSSIPRIGAERSIVVASSEIQETKSGRVCDFQL